jgi:hypothetical protein
MGIGIIDERIEQLAKLLCSLDPFNIGHWILKNQEVDLRAGDLLMDLLHLLLYLHQLLALLLNPLHQLLALLLCLLVHSARQSRDRLKNLRSCIEGWEVLHPLEVNG